MSPPHLLELFSGTGSIGKVFRAAGWRVTSVDCEPRFRPTICCDVLQLEPGMVQGHVDLIWASPPCTMYSIARTTAKTPRDLEGSDRLVQKVLDLADQFFCYYFMENPQSGLLKGRDVVKDIPMFVVDYCMYADADFPHKARNFHLDEHKLDASAPAVQQGLRILRWRSTSRRGPEGASARQAYE